MEAEGITVIELLPLPEGSEAGEYMMDAILFDHSDMASYARANIEYHTKKMRAEIEALQNLCAAAYQMAGVHDAPVVWLDALSNAANGKSFSSDGLLPYMPKAVCDAVSRAKRLEEALRKYGNHIGCCPDNCECGLNKVLREQEGEP